MYKKLILVIIASVFILSGCSWSDKGSNSDNYQLVFISKPVSVNSEEKVYFRLAGSKNGESATENTYLYSYSLYEKGSNINKLLSSYPSNGPSGPNSEVYYSNLVNGKTYIFKGNIYDKESGKSLSESSYEFSIRYNFKFEYGVVTDSNDIYGEKDGILKADQEFKVYTKLYNTDSSISDNLLSGSLIKIKLDLSSFSGATFVNDTAEKTFSLGQTGVVWSLKAPSVKTLGSLKFIIEETPKYTESNKPVIEGLEKNYVIESRIPGVAAINSFAAVSSSIVAGESLSVKVSLKNSGSDAVTVTNYKLNFYDKYDSTKSYDSDWSVTSDTADFTIAAGSTVEKTITYKSSNSPSNLGLIKVVFSGISKDGYLTTGTLINSSSIEITLSY